jgi:hypothetical protein
VLEAEKRVRRYHSLPASATASVNITPVPARVSFSVSLLVAGPALGPALVSFVTSPSILPVDTVLSLSPDGDGEDSYILLAVTSESSSMPSLMPNASDTDFFIKLAAFRDALVCLLPAAFDAIVKVLAMPELSGPA